jgi:hypothetical protein
MVGRWVYPPDIHAGQLASRVAPMQSDAGAGRFGCPEVCLMGARCEGPMTERRTTYIEPTYTLYGYQPKVIDGVTFRLYHTENNKPALISDDGQLMVKRGYINASFTAYVLGHGPIPGGKMPPKRFRNEERACAEAVGLFKIIRGAQ